MDEGTLVEYVNKKGKWVRGRTIDKDKTKADFIIVENEYKYQSSVSIDNLRLTTGITCLYIMFLFGFDYTFLYLLY